MGLLGSLTETDSGAASRIQLDAGADVGDHVVVMARWISATQTASSVTDSQGNTYTPRQSQDMTGLNITLVAYSSQITTALTSADYIDVNWTNAAYTYRSAEAYALAGCSGYDQSAKGVSEYGQTVSVSANTAAASTQLVGWLCTHKTVTYGSSSWTASGPTQEVGNYHNYRMIYTASSAGAADPGGSLSDYNAWAVVWVAAAIAATAAFARPSSDVAGGTFRSILVTAPFGPRVIA
jgi:hypothetical protein